MPNCHKCGQSPLKAAERGAYLKRANEYGVDGIWECSPTCDHLHGDQNDALLGALENADADHAAAQKLTGEQS